MGNPNDPTTGNQSYEESMDPDVAGEKSRIKQVADHVAERAKSAARKVVSEGAQRVERSGTTASSALRRAASEVEGEETWLSAALRKSADGIETVTRSLAGGDINQVAAQVTDFARRQPALFLGASLALGFAAARLGKTALEGSRVQDGQGYGEGYSPPRFDGGETVT